MTDEAYRFRIHGQGYQTMLAPANPAALEYCRTAGENVHVYAVFQETDPAKMEAHNFLFALLRAMHSNWPGDPMSFDWWRQQIKQVVPGAYEVREGRRGPVAMPESWSPYDLSKRRQMEIIERVKEICRQHLGWSDDNIEEAVRNE